MNIKHLREIPSVTPFWGAKYTHMGYKNFAIFDQ